MCDLICDLCDLHDMVKRHSSVDVHVGIGVHVHVHGVCVAPPETPASRVLGTRGVRGSNYVSRKDWMCTRMSTWEVKPDAVEFKFIGDVLPHQLYEDHELSP